MMLATLLEALEQTIVATARPQIASDLHGFPELSWVSTAYLASPSWLRCARRRGIGAGGLPLAVVGVGLALALREQPLRRSQAAAEPSREAA